MTAILLLYVNLILLIKTKILLIKLSNSAKNIIEIER